jgi:predicted HTH transcriptional regulator
MKNKPLEANFKLIKESLEAGVFRPVEKEWLELKDLSAGGDWTSLKETICAFLNTRGGIIIAGIKEKQGQQYTVTGFNRDNENNLVEMRTKIFKDETGTLPDLSDYFHFEYDDTTFSCTVAVIYIDEIPADMKYLQFKGKYFERILTGDREISAAKIRIQAEYKLDREFAREIGLVESAGIDDLSLEKINAYIGLFNREIQKESLKPTIPAAQSFLERQHFCKEGKITTLGMLVCGTEPFRFLENRAEVDCYYETGEDIAKDKRIFRNDVLSLMEDVFTYVWGHIKVGRTAAGGGASTPEYPENLIREVLNNALAHRDYSENKCITVVIKPDDCLEIRNPGTFKQKMQLVHADPDTPIRRIVPGVPETKNPKLASVLKVFEKIESRGRGMATLVNECLANRIDVPYYELTPDQSVILRITSGRLVDDSMQAWFDTHHRYIARKLGKELDDEHKAVMAYLYKSEVLNAQRRYTILLTENNNHFGVIAGLRQCGLIIESTFGNETTPVYIIDRELMKKRHPELQRLLGNAYKYADEMTQHVLNIIYTHNTYNEEPITARKITPGIYYDKYGKRIDIKKYENTARKIREICQKMVKINVLLKDNGRKGYRINSAYQEPPQTDFLHQLK